MGGSRCYSFGVQVGGGARRHMEGWVPTDSDLLYFFQKTKLKETR